MDSRVLDDIAHSVVKLRMYPYFDIAHYVLMSCAIRDDTPQSGSGLFSRKHPFACWFATMLMCFGGSILANFVLGEPIFSCFDDHLAVFTATVVWYLINYSPFDIVYKLYSIFSIRVLICAMKEVQRAKKISLGVSHAFHDNSHSAVTCVLVGLLKGTGYLEMKIFARLVRGVWLPASTEFLQPSFTSKISLLSAIVFYCDLLDMIPLPRHELFLIVVGVLVYMRVAMLCLGLKDPFAPLQNLTCTIFFGGVVDALKVAFNRRNLTEDSTDGGTVFGQPPNQNVIPVGPPGSPMPANQDGGLSSSAGGAMGSVGKDTLRRSNPSAAPVNSSEKKFM